MPLTRVRGMSVRLQLFTPEVINDEEMQLLRRLAELRPKAPLERERGFWAKVKESLGA